MSWAMSRKYHSNQGIVHVLLEGIFAHGQSHVLISRSPDEEQFWCVGIPPEDILFDVLMAVRKQRAAAKRFLEQYQSLDTAAHARVASSCKDIGEKMLPLRRRIALVLDRYTRSKQIDAMSAKKIVGLLIKEEQRLELVDGIESTISVTSRFTAGKTALRGST